MTRLRDIYAALVDIGDKWTPETAEGYARRDVDFTDITVSKNDENSFWKATVRAKNPDGGWYSPATQKRMIISERDQDTGKLLHVLTGRIEGWPIGFAGSEIEFDVVASASAKTTQNAGTTDLKIEDLEDQALGSLDDDPWQLFTRTDAGTRRKPADRLGARYAVLHWPRDDYSPPVLVDRVYGAAFVDLGRKWIEKTLVLDKPNGRPITRVEVSLECEFEETRFNLLDLGIALGGNMLAPRVFGTLSPRFKLPLKLGQKIGDWSVVQCILQQTGGGPYGYDDFTPAYLVSTKVTPKMDPTVKKSVQVTKSNRYQRYFYGLDLKVGGVTSVRRKEKVMFAVEWKGQDVAGYEGRSDELNLTVSNLRGFVEYPQWQAGASYGVGSRITIDGMKWECRVGHNAGGEFYSDVGKWMPVMLDVFEALGGPAVPVFFGAPATLSVQLIDGNQQIIYRNPVPGLTAIRYAYNQAYARMMETLRQGATFDIPWSYVRSLVGSERVRISDPQIKGGFLDGKIVSISSSLVQQRATVKIACIPGRGTPSQLPGQPVYNVQASPGGRVLNATIDRDFQFMEGILAQYQFPLKYDLGKIIKDNPTVFNFAVSPIPQGLDTDVKIPFGTYLVDAPRMINME